MPPELGRPAALTSLALIESGVRSPPDIISHLPALQETALYENDYIVLQSGFWFLPGLTSLTLTDGGDLLPNSISQLTTLLQCNHASVSAFVLFHISSNSAQPDLSDRDVSAE